MNSFLERRFYRDSVNKKISGVCSGIAKHYGWERWVVRLVTLILFFNFPLFVAAGYGIASFIIPEKGRF